MISYQQTGQRLSLVEGGSRASSAPPFPEMLLPTAHTPDLKGSVPFSSRCVLRSACRERAGDPRASAPLAGSPRDHHRPGNITVVLGTRGRSPKKGKRFRQNV